MAEQEVANEAVEPAVPHAELPPAFEHHDIQGQWALWFQDEGPWWLCSFVFHLVLVCALGLVAGRAMHGIDDEAPSFEAASVAKQESPQAIERFEIGETPLDPTELSTETLTLEKPAQIAQDERHYDEGDVFIEKGGGMAAATNQANIGGLGGFDMKSLGAGPIIKAKGGVGVGVGAGSRAGSGGDGSGFGGRGSGSRKAMLASGGGTKQSERAVAGALNWIARHQSLDGGWAMKSYTAACTIPRCTDGEVAVGERRAAATAFGLLPFFGAGQTHLSKGPYTHIVYRGVAYLINNQKNDGDLRLGGTMYDQGLATIALCECYGMSGDKHVGMAAQAGLNFIMASQDPVGGGWRYLPRQPGDTSVAGWQVMALKSGMMAGLKVDPIVFDKTKRFLKSVAAGTEGSFGFGGTFGYIAPEPRPSLTAVGLLCCQYMGLPRTDPAMIEGTAMLMANLPSTVAGNIYYCYYATQVMHNQPGADWDIWNRKMRRALIDTQCRAGCANGSWDAEPQGAVSRVMSTSLSALTLEVYYRYLPLYKLDVDNQQGAGASVKSAKGL